MTGPGSFCLGIDFGTTHTVAALAWPDGRVQPVLFDSTPLLLSAVYADDDGRLIVGRDAERSARLDPTRFEPNPKRRIDDGTVLLGSWEFPVSDLVAAVLRRAFGEAVRVAGAPPAQTVLTHPAEWGPQRRQALVNAARQAGLGEIVLVPEPLAAAAHFTAVLGHHVPPGRALVVYDFGGGTFDISVVRRRGDGGWDVLATEGLPDVGGVDLDSAIIDHIGVTVAAADPVGWQRLLNPTTPDERRGQRMLREDAQSAKEQLSRTAAAVIHVPRLDVDARITREEFEGITRPWLEQTVALTASTLFRTGLRQDQIAGVLLVGGSSRIPLVGTLLHQRLGIAPTLLDQPELVVVQGSLRAVPAAAAPAPPIASAAQAAAPAPPPAPSSGPPAPVSPSASTWNPAPLPVPPPGPAGAYPLWPQSSPPIAPAVRAKRGPLRRHPAAAAGAGLVAVMACVLAAAVALNVGPFSTSKDGAENPAATGTTPTTGAKPPPAPVDNTLPTLPATTSPSLTAGPPPSPVGTVVRYEVTASGRGNAGSVQYSDVDGTLIYKRGIPFPWRLEFTVVGRDPAPVIIAQRLSGGDAGPVTCRITVNGKVIADVTERGQYAAPQCS